MAQEQHNKHEFNKHEFSLYYHDTTALARNNNNNQIIITDELFIHRVTHILRYKEHDSLCIFDRNTVITAVIMAPLHKKKLILSLVSSKKTERLTPEITVLLPLLKKEHLEEAIYNAVETGATTVQLILTEKVQRSWGGTKEYERLERIMIAAAEQSKNYNYPLLCEPVKLEKFLIDHTKSALNSSRSNLKVFAEPTGMPLPTLLNTITRNKPTTIILCIGPEGDLTPKEKSLLTDNDFIFCALTPTILRAYQAATVLTAFIRSIL